MWSTLANNAGNVTIGEADLDEALGAAQAVGDDRIQAQAGQVNPETWTHGSAEQPQGLLPHRLPRRHHGLLRHRPARLTRQRPVPRQIPRPVPRQGHLGPRRVTAGGLARRGRILYGCGGVWRAAELWLILF